MPGSKAKSKKKKKETAMQLNEVHSKPRTRRVAVGRRLLQISMAEPLHAEVRRTAEALDMPIAQWIRTLCIQALVRDKPAVDWSEKARSTE
jgi:hypothetical protein